MRHRPQSISIRHLHNPYYVFGILAPLLALVSAMLVLGLALCMLVFMELGVSGGLEHFGINPFVVPAFALALVLEFWMTRLTRAKVILWRREKHRWVMPTLLATAGCVGIVIVLRMVVGVLQG